MKHRRVVRRLSVWIVVSAVWLLPASAAAVESAEIIALLRSQLTATDMDDGNITLRSLPAFVQDAPCTAMHATFRTELTGVKVAGAVPVLVRCDAPAPWTAFISATIAVEQPVLVACHSLARGKPLTREDLCQVRRAATALRQHALVEPHEALGMTLKRPVTRGSVLYRAQLTATTLVKRGESIIISAERGSARIAVRGTALQAGAFGEQIRVQNDQSGRKLAAWVLGPGRVSGSAPPTPETAARDISEISAKVQGEPADTDFENPAMAGN